MSATVGPAQSQWRVRTIRAADVLSERVVAVAVTPTERQRNALTVLAVAALVAVADALLRTALPSSAQPLLTAALFIAGAALAVHGNRFWSRVVGEPEPHCEAEGVAMASAAAPIVATAPITVPAVDPRPTAATIDRSIDELGQFPVFTEILTSQMASIIALSDGAAHGIMAGLAQVDTEVTTLMSMIRQSDTGVAVGDIVGDIEIKVAACNRLLERFNERQVETSRLEAALRLRLEEDSQSVLRVVAGVRRIAQQSTLLSFNIAIEAGHLGSKDNGFAFIADQVRRLAQDVDSLAGQLTSQFGDIMQSMIVESQALAAERHVAEGDDVAALRTTLAGLDGDFRTLVAHQRDVLTKVATGSEAVATPILAMMGSVQFQDIIRQQIEQLTLTVDTVGGRISGISAMLRTDVDDADAPNLSQLLDGLFKGYVMDGQRGAHLAAKGEAPPAPAGLLIELF